MIHRPLLPIVLSLLILPGFSVAPSAAKPSLPTQQTAQAPTRQLLTQGNQISLNGRLVAIPWGQWQSVNDPTTSAIGLSDTGLMRAIGVDLLNTTTWDRQPVQWFSEPNNDPLILDAFFTGQHRYLNLTALAQKSGWQLQPNGNVLQITFPPAQVLNLRQGQQSGGDRYVLDLDRPTPWQIDQQGQELILALDGNADPSLVQRFQPNLLDRLRNLFQSRPTPKLETAPNRTVIRIPLEPNQRFQVSTLTNPARLVLDLRPDIFTYRDISWAPGLRWQQQLVNLGSSRFPIISLSVDLSQPGLALKPIWGNPNTLVGINPLAQVAQVNQAAAAINGGFFNRKTQLPLGAIRQNGQWISSPILNRGAIAWNDNGDILMGRLALQETLTTATGQRLSITSVNSGYVQAGIARYTPAWGPSYTPLLNDEMIVTVQGDRILSQQPGLPNTAFPIPPDGYLLILRANRTALNALPIGSSLQINQTTLPNTFERYPNILGAGPLLIQNRQIVLDATAEQFSPAFIREKAIRSVIAQTATGNLLIVAIQNRLGGPGPTLAETAQIMQQLGVSHALNLDGGSSTTLYLGDQLLNRLPRTAARIHNGLGIFSPPLP